MALTPRQQRFTDEYLIDLNATQAAIRAGYAEPTANREGSRLLSNVDIQEAIAEAMRERSLRCKMAADEVLLRLARLARASMQDYAAWGPNGVTLKDSATLPAEVAACVAEVAQTISAGGGSIRFKLHDQVKALELCGKHLGLFKDVLDHRYPDGIPPIPYVRVHDSASNESANGPVSNGNGRHS